MSISFGPRFDTAAKKIKPADPRKPFIFDRLPPNIIEHIEQLAVDSEIKSYVNRTYNQNTLTEQLCAATTADDLRAVRYLVEVEHADPLDLCPVPAGRWHDPSSAWTKAIEIASIPIVEFFLHHGVPQTTMTNNENGAQFTPLEYTVNLIMRQIPYGGVVEPERRNMFDFWIRRNAGAPSDNCVATAATLIGDAYILEQLLDQGGNANAFNFGGGTLLSDAVSRRDIRKLQSLLNHGANINVTYTTSNGFDPNEIPHTVLWHLQHDTEYLQNAFDRNEGNVEEAKEYLDIARQYEHLLIARGAVAL